MNYFFLYQILKAQLSSDVATHASDECAFNFYLKKFHSDSIVINDNGYGSPFDVEMSQDNPNGDFSYPVFHPSPGQPSDGCIILLHGLNERRWEKYLPWAYQLASYTNKTVILFPLAYHMNRSPLEWGNPHKMMAYVKHRQVNQPEAKQLSVANVALSERLTDHPERFFLSGYQAANDLLNLVKRIQLGHYGEIKKNTQVDFFAYSIGAFLMQVLMMAHGEKELDKSRLFMFCGGSTFDDLQGVSKYIMDSVAFERIQHYYKYDVDSMASGQLKDAITNTPIGQSFLDMISRDRLSERRSCYSSALWDRISAVVLKNDAVVLADRVKKTWKGMRVEEWDFPYTYSHIMPFPLLSNNWVDQVNKAFDRLMLRASLLFTT